MGSGTAFKKSCKSDYKIYVGSIPGSANAGQLASYFRKFGCVRRIQMPINASCPKINRGYCWLTVRNLETYNAVLQHKEHSFGDRILMCAPFMTGKQLRTHNFCSNSRRVIVRNIPNDFTSSDLREAFQPFGKVLMAYIFSSPDKLDREKSSKTKTGSIQFECSKVAQNLIQKREVKVHSKNGSQKLLVFLFQHKDEGYGSPKNPKSSQVKKGELEKDYESHHSIISKDESSVSEADDSKLSNSQRQSQFDSVTYQNSSLKVKKGIGISAAKLPLKPTQKDYYTIRRFLFKHENTQTDNYRLNQSSTVGIWPFQPTFWNQEPRLPRDDYSLTNPWEKRSPYLSLSTFTQSPRLEHPNPQPPLLLVNIYPTTTTDPLSSRSSAQTENEQYD